jgi:hypothetical protein
MKICWLDDFTLSERPGGAERSSAQMIEHGRARGHEVVIATPRAPVPISGFDLFILNNVHTFPERTFEKLIERRLPYMTWMHDFNFCNQRTAIGHDCTFLCKVGLWRRIFQHSLFNFFLSPAQHKVYQKYFNLDPARVGFVLPPVDEKQFPFGTDERNPRVLVFEGPPHKGHKVALAKHEGQTTLMHAVPYEHMPVTLRGFASIAMYPTVVEACGRLAIEACLSGCKVLANQNVGFFSWPIDFTKRTAIVEELRKSPITFWEKVESLGQQDNHPL